MITFVQGVYLPVEEARVPVIDRGFLYGDSVYETVRSVGGRILFWDDHALRLHQSAAMLGFELEPQPYDLLEVMRQLLVRNRLEDARIRIIVTRGVGGRDQIDGFVPTWVVLIEPFQTFDESEYRKGVAAVLVSVRRLGTETLNPEIKSSNLLNNLLARREARLQGAAEGIMLNPKGLLAEGAHSNLFWVTQKGVLRTPSRSAGILPGVTRQKVLELARSQSIPLEEVEALPDELDSAREILLTSTSWEVLGVTRYNAHLVGTGRQGEITRQLHQDLRDLYEREGQFR
jgi:branched-chain amino acid aminotransferase